MGDKKHAKFSASSSERWLNCPGSIALIEKAPKPPESSFALEGTQAHECLEKLLRKELTKAKALKLYGQAMVDNAGIAIEYIKSKTKKGTQVFIEQKVWLDFIDPEMFGTLDVGLVQPDGSVEIIDYKYGAGVAVDPEDNTQLGFYALGLVHKLAPFQNESLELSKSVTLTVVQPRVEGEAVRSALMSAEGLVDLGSRLLRGVLWAKRPNAPTRAGDWCRFCPAKVICPAISKQAMLSAQIDFTDVAIEPVLPDFTQMTLGRVGEVLPKLDLIEKWIGSVREHAFNQLKAGHHVKGYKLVAKRATRKWANERELAELAQLEFGDKVLDTSLKSPAQLEKVIGKEWVTKNCVLVSSGETIAPDDDKRPAVNSAEKDFSDL